MVSTVIVHFAIHVSHFNLWYVVQATLSWHISDKTPSFWHLTLVNISFAHFVGTMIHAGLND